MNSHEALECHKMIHYINCIYYNSNESIIFDNNHLVSYYSIISNYY